MAEARLERTTVEIGSQDGQVGLRATGQVVLFEGFMAIYLEGRDDPAPGATDGEDDDARLPQMAEGDALQKLAVTPEQHFTQPPPRYTEATLVKRMEELGIGRPSTYASIVTTIQDREYVRKENNRLIPEDKGRLVTAFLTNYFRRYVEYDFTAGLEDQLDHISAGEADYKEVLSRFWHDFSAAIAETADLRIGEVLDKIDEVLSPHLYPPRADGTDPRLCPTCGKGRLSMRTARTGGAFIGCSNYPDCRYTRPFGPPSEDGEAQTGERLLGHVEGDPVWLKDGRFGPYVQRGEATAETPKPPRASLPKGWAAADMDLEKALRLLSLPRLVGPHPEDGQPIEAGIGRYGPFVKHGPPTPTSRGRRGLRDRHEPRARRPGPEGRRPRRRAGPRRAEPMRALGEHPDGGDVAVMPGRFGPLREVGQGQRHDPQDPRAPRRSRSRRRWPGERPRRHSEEGPRQAQGSRQGPRKPRRAKAPAKPRRPPSPRPPSRRRSPPPRSATWSRTDPLPPAAARR
jgi:DNA topoisomerase-1